jgi:hypothetical protein
MYCSSCGADNQSPNSYCKRCGEWLPDIKKRGGLAFGGETPQQNIFTGLFMSALSALAALFSAIALYATYLGSSGAKWSVYVAAAFCLCIAGWQTSSFIVNLKLRQRLRKGRDGSVPVPELTNQQKPALNAGAPDAFVGTPSVTESTTRILQPAQGRQRDTQR